MKVNFNGTGGPKYGGFKPLPNSELYKSGTNIKQDRMDKAVHNNSVKSIAVKTIIVVAVLVVIGLLTTL